MANEEMNTTDGTADGTTDNGRRDFLKLLGLGAASLAACGRLPVKEAIPLLIPADEITPGVPALYATRRLAFRARRKEVVSTARGSRH